MGGKILKTAPIEPCIQHKISLGKGGRKLKEILNLLPVLFIAIAMNIASGLYYNIGTKKLSFTWEKLITGIIKAGIIAGMFVGLAYCFGKTDLSAIGVTPIFVMTSAIILYVGKALLSLGKILGVHINTNKEA